MAKNNGIIRRRIGGVSQQTGKGTDISKLKRKSKKYEDISSTYEAARKDKQKSKVTEKKKTTTPTTTTTTKTDIRTPIRTKLSSAVGRKARGEAAASKVFKRATEKAAATARGKAARERLYSGAKKGSDPKEVARRIDLRKEDAIREAARKRERAPVTIKTLKPLARQVYDKPIGPPPPPLHELLVEKTGGKVSRRKGGTVSRTEGGKVWNGNEAVAEGYD